MTALSTERFERYRRMSRIRASAPSLPRARVPAGNRAFTSEQSGPPHPPCPLRGALTSHRIRTFQKSTGANLGDLLRPQYNVACLTLRYH